MLAKVLRSLFWIPLEFHRQNVTASFFFRKSITNGELRGEIRFWLLWSSEHEISCASLVSERALDGQLQDIQPALEPVDGVDNPVLIDIDIID
jgi:hypothetical protein